MQDQQSKVQQECTVHDEVQEAVQEGQEEEEAVPEDLLRAGLPRLRAPAEALLWPTARPVLSRGVERWSPDPPGLSTLKKGQGRQLVNLRIVPENLSCMRVLLCAVDALWGGGGAGEAPEWVTRIFCLMFHMVTCVCPLSPAPFA